MAKDNRGEKRGRILKSAIASFSENGFYRTRICDVARAAGVADGTVYLYFESKEQLLAAIFEDSMEHFLGGTRKELDSLGSSEEKLRRLFELHLDALTQDEELATVFQIELRHSQRFMKETSRAQLREYLEIINALVQEGQDAGEFRGDLDSWVVTRAAFGILDQVATSWVLSDRKYRPATQIGSLMDVIFDGIKVCPETPPSTSTE